MKTLIHVWTHHFNIDQNHVSKYNHLGETNFYFGLGDLIRSTIKLYYLSKKMNFNLYVDLQLHPISQFLTLPFNPFSQLVLDNRDNVEYVCYGAVEAYISNAQQNKILYILTNDFYDGEVDEDCKEFIKSILQPSPKMEEYVNYVIDNLPFSNFNIIHVRIGDQYFNNKKTDVNLKEIMKIISSHKTENDILITDTPYLKKEMFINESIFSLNTLICHLGLETNPDKIRDTLLDFYLMTRCASIKTYCKIHEVSGFVKWVSIIYDKPLQKI